MVHLYNPRLGSMYSSVSGLRRHGFGLAELPSRDAQQTEDD